MSNPLRIDCSTETEIPHSRQLAELAVRGRHVVLQFPVSEDGTGPDIDKPRLIRKIAAQMPEHFSVFDSGAGPGQTTAITIFRVISRAEVLRHEEEIVEAARHFRRAARECVEALAVHLRISLSQFPTGNSIPGVRQHGRMRQGWSYFFHGFECRFEHRSTGQIIEVRLGFKDEFGVLDPYFFAEYVGSTPGLETVSCLFGDSYHDPSRALSILEERGRLRRVERNLMEGWGLVACDENTKPTTAGTSGQ